MKKVNRLQLRLQKEKKKTTQKAEQIAKDKEKEEDIAVQQEEVGISSSAAMEKARKEAQLRKKEEEAVTPAHKSGIYGVPANQREVGTESMRKYAQSMVPGQETIIGVDTKNIKNFINKYRKSKKK